MHQFLIQWIDDEIEVTYADNPACAALADASVDWNHSDVTFLIGHVLLEFVSIVLRGTGPFPSL